MERAFDVFPYSASNLAEALSPKSSLVPRTLKNNHYLFFREYLGDKEDALQARTIVIEHKYISRSYLNDYSNFYSASFGQYDRFCKRIHFFKEIINEELFTNMINAPTTQYLAQWESYIGCIVLKPLPVTNIGPTLLKVYPSSDTQKRHFPCIRDYQVNLFGHTLKLDTLAFQEQDNAVAACASIALWSAFQKTSQLFQTGIPSPSNITKSAKNNFTTTGRTYPNAGLSYYQIGNAIEATGLEFEMRNQEEKLKNLNLVKAIIYAYGRLGLPILLGILVEDVGDHLILITGYKDNLESECVNSKTISLKAYQIERLYAHDDQIGPFSRLGIFEKFGNQVLETSWHKDGAKKRASVRNIIIPIHQKVRLTFENIFEIASKTDIYMNTLLGEKFELYWDVYLEFSNNYKEALHSQPLIGNSLKWKLLTDCMPRYIWIARGFVQNFNQSNLLFEMIFDATDIQKADNCLYINIFNPSFREKLREELPGEDVKDFIINEWGNHLYELWFNAANSNN